MGHDGKSWSYEVERRQRRERSREQQNENREKRTNSPLERLYLSYAQMLDSFYNAFQWDCYNNALLSLSQLKCLQHLLPSGYNFLTTPVTVVPRWNWAQEARENNTKVRR